MKKSTKKSVPKAQVGRIVKSAIKYGKKAVKGAMKAYDDVAKKMAGNTSNLRRGEDWDRYGKDVLKAKVAMTGAAAGAAAGGAALYSNKKQADAKKAAAKKLQGRYKNQ